MGTDPVIGYLTHSGQDKPPRLPHHNGNCGKDISNRPFFATYPFGKYPQKCPQKISQQYATLYTTHQMPYLQPPFTRWPTTLEHSHEHSGACSCKLEANSNKYSGMEGIPIKSEQSCSRQLMEDSKVAKAHTTHGWVLATGSIVLLFTGAGPIDGPFDLSSSTRRELGGLASSLLLIAAMSRLWGIRHRASFRWCADSKAAISRALRYAHQRSRYYMPPDSDLLSLIRNLLREI